MAVFAVAEAMVGEEIDVAVDRVDGAVAEGHVEAAGAGAAEVAVVLAAGGVLAWGKAAVAGIGRSGE
jgi:hypothetical protein